MLANVGFADDFDGASDPSLGVEALTHLTEGAFAEDSADLVLACDVGSALQHLELTELKHFLRLAHLGRTRVLGHV